MDCVAGAAALDRNSCAASAGMASSNSASCLCSAFIRGAATGAEKNAFTAPEKHRGTTNPEPFEISSENQPGETTQQRFALVSRSAGHHEQCGVPTITAPGSRLVSTGDRAALALNFRICGRQMESPKLFDRVRLCGDTHPFFVISVDEERQLLDLMPVSGRGPCLDSVPFAAVQHGTPEPAKSIG